MEIALIDIYKFMNLKSFQTAYGKDLIPAAKIIYLLRLFI